MSQELADFVRDKCSVVAVSDAFRLAPWATALVSNDAGWWRAHPDSMNFAGRKFCGGNMAGTERLPQTSELSCGINSGCQGIRVARDYFGAKKILLLGFDLSSKNGHHFFGKHPDPLKNTTDHRFRNHIAQFDRLRIKDIQIINCTPGSSLTRFPFADIHEVLHP